MVEITLRDYFASLAMQGMIANGKYDYNNLTKESYRYADKMIEEKWNKGNERQPT